MPDIDETLPDPFVGNLFAGRYRIEAVIGRGGMGTVYKAHHEVLARDVAIKVLHPRLLARPNAAQMFRREARAVSRVDHPNVTAIYDFGHDDGGNPYIAMEYVVGRSLTSQLVRGEQQAPISLMRAIGILAQVAEALAAAHAVNVVHRDLKPENVLLCSNRGVDDFVKVLDFGIARLVDGSETTSLSDGDFFGTPAYMSPEQSGSGADIGPASDLYALGVIAYELTTGRPPFDAQGMQLLFHHRHNVPPPPAAARG
ncbi:MAG: serine/threonine protein kinase, partial [Myxococcales bacterium]|nr:serine/threonine protein kinase [Myxococcales bacterium]